MGELEDDERFVAATEDIMRDVLSSEIKSSDGTIGWPALHRNPDSGRLTVRGREGLYRGQLGIAVFSGALYQITGNESYLDTATRIAEPLADPRERAISPEIPIGVGNGLTSWIYAFVKLADFLDDYTFLDAATNVSKLVTVERIESDDELDVMSGVAGGILGLLSLYDETEERDVLQTAITCGDKLLEERIRMDEGSAWLTSEDWPLTGYAHGQAGISYALFRLGAAANATRFTEAAADAVKYESTEYEAGERNWRDLRPGTGEFMDGWCNGRTGIGLARLGSLEYVDSIETLDRDVKRCTDSVSDSLPEGDCLCHGTFGQVELLLSAGHRREDKRLIRRATEMASSALNRRHRRGIFQLPLQQYKGVCRASLFLGLAGIGYQFLRLSDPESVPSLLLFH